MTPTIIIPAYNPDEKLVFLVHDIVKKLPSATIIVVNDASKPECIPIFQQCANPYDCIICRHSKNMGKGAALKTGIAKAMQIRPNAGFVTADADGQHSAEDIAKVALTLEQNPQSIVLGVRNFSEEQVPFKSRWGNRVTASLFEASSGIACTDTQTGLRGIPNSLGELSLEITGNRYEYEMNFLLEAAKNQVSFIEVPIHTIYIDENKSSHFHVFRDSFLIYKNLLKFAVSSLSCSAIDIMLFAILSQLVFGNSAVGLLGATIIARLGSGITNFLINRRWVFGQQGQTKMSGVRYGILFVGQIIASWALTSALSLLLPTVASKIIVDFGLFFLSYKIQKKFVFSSSKGAVVAKTEVKA